MRKISDWFGVTAALLLTAGWVAAWAPGLAAQEPEAKASSRDIKIPRALVARIEREYKEFLKKQEAPDKETIERGLLNLSVEFTQDRKAALQDNALIVTPVGGGVIVLSDLVTPLKGAFRVKLTPSHGPDGAVALSRVYFISHAKTRKVAGEIYGDGCDKFMDITKAFESKWLGSGLEVYTADQRYLSVLGGTFLFVEFEKEELYAASVTFTDSRYPELLCEKQ
jgi:hypothetical protein